MHIIRHSISQLISIDLRGLQSIHIDFYGIHKMMLLQTGCTVPAGVLVSVLWRRKVTGATCGCRQVQLSVERDIRRMEWSESGIGTYLCCHQGLVPNRTPELG